MKHISMFLMILSVSALLLSSCTDAVPSGPTPSLGNATVVKYVSIGNSLTAGYQSSGLYASAQQYSYPNMIAQQLGVAGATLGTFQQPLYSDPGTPDATGKASRYEILGWTAAGPTIGPRGVAAGAPTNSALVRPYDNLGIPGIPLAGFMDTTGTYQSSPLGPGAILRWATGPFPKSVYKQVKLLNPDLITFWLGANDVLGYATSGGVSPAAPTPTSTFAFLYNQALDSLRASFPTAKIVVANIPDVKAIPFFTTIGPKIAASMPAGYKLYYQRANYSVDSTTFTEATAPLITLVGGSYTAYLGQASGKFYRDKNINPAQVGADTTKPFGFTRQNPWPNALALDSDEQATAAAAVIAFNTTIATKAASVNAGLVDIYAFFNDIKAHGLSIAGMTFKTDYVSGGLFSLDGVHPSNRGYAVVANEWLRVINAKFGMSIPFVTISNIPGLDAPLAKAASTGMPQFTPGAFDHFPALFRQSNE